MTTEKLYHCNFCRCQIKDSDGHGLVWAGEKLESTMIRQAENHLCGPCARSLATVLGRLYQPKDYKADAAENLHRLNATSSG